MENFTRNTVNRLCEIVLTGNPNVLLDYINQEHNDTDVSHLKHVQMKIHCMDVYKNDYSYNLQY